MITIIKTIGFCFFNIVFFVACQQPKKSTDKILPQWQKPKTISYHIENAKLWLENKSIGNTQLQIALAVNRTDSSNFIKMDSVVIPDDFSGDIVYYLPFPLSVTYLKPINKIIFFSYPTQTFATYEKGALTHTGPTNMGRKNATTPTGLFNANWKAEKTTSTFNDEWELLWNVNIENKEGVGWHQYALPGYPASHSCLRLLEKDARFLYNWADQWIVSGNDSVLVNGTPVIIFGTYNFDAPKPWLQLITDPHSLDITEDEIQKQTTSFLATILSEQKKREIFETSK